MEQWFDTCLVCGESFFSKEDMIEHVKSHQSPKTPTTKKESKTVCHCPFCPFKGVGSVEIQSHMSREHVEELATPEKAAPVSACIDLTEDQASGGVKDTAVKSCPLCSKANFDSIDAMNLHINEHFIEEGDEQQPQADDELLAIRLQQEEKYLQFQKSQKAAENFHFEQLKDQFGMGEDHRNTGYRKQALRNIGRSVGRSMTSFEYYSNKLEMLEKLEDGIDDGMTTNTTVLEHLQIYLERTINQGERAWLSCGTDFVGRGPGDSGWGCGYRNIQTVLSSLTKNPKYLQTLGKTFHGNIPSIPKIQEMIEAAWAQGYDQKGKEQLSGRLIKTRKWIGATEAFTFFASLNFHCRILDFTRPSGPNNTHPLLFEWVYKYFRDAASRGKVVFCDKPPLYLQHDGHSRTIVGVICKDLSSPRGGRSNTLKLIIFDPGISKFGIWRKDRGRKLSSSAPSKPELCTQKFIKPVSSLTKQQFQIVSVVGWASPQRSMEQKNVDLVSEKLQ